MGVSIYYTARRDQELGAAESARVDEIAAAANVGLLAEIDRLLPGWKSDAVVPAEVSAAGEICEGLSFYARGPATEPGVILEGASKVSHSECGFEPMVLQLEHHMAALARIRLAVPGAEWHVHVDDTTLEWRPGNGEDGEYVHPGAP